MKLNLLCFVTCAFLLAQSCSKKEMPLHSIQSAVTVNNNKQITWTQGAPIIDGTYTIIKKGTMQAVEAGGTSGSKIQLNGYANNASQQWNISDAGNGYFKIINAASNKALESASNDDGSQLQQNDYTGGDNQLWNITHQGLGLYEVINKGNNLALSIDNDASANGTKIIQSKFTNTSPQLLAITLADYSAPVTDSVTIDLGNQTVSINHVAAGFLHGFAEDGTPADSLVDPLSINTVRDWTFYMNTVGPRLNAKGIKQQVVMSDEWSQPYGANPPGPPGTNSNWTAWDNFITTQVNYIRTLATSTNLQYDIWNEPNGGGFWPYSGTYAFPGWFFQTWLHAYQAIRAVDPKAVIVGPSYNNYDLPNLKLFISYCKANNCMPNYLSWHFASNPVQEVSDMTTLLADSGVSVSGFQINEYTTAAQEYAGESAYLIAQLERAKVNAAMHAIWTNDNGYLDGIITPESSGNQKMATWWVYKSYSDISGNIVATTPGSYVDLIGALNNSPRFLKILLGTKPGLPQGNVKVKFINVSSSVTNNNTSIHVSLQHIADAAGGTLTPNAPPFLFDMNSVVTYGNNMQFLINWSSIYDAYYFQAGPSK
jgi:hypothetical protein